MTAADASGAARLSTPVRAVLVAFALVLLVFTKDRPDSWADGSRMGTIQALVEHGTLALDETDYLWQGDKVRIDGRFYSHQPPMLALIGALPYAVLHHGFGRAIDDPFTYRMLTWLLVGLPLFAGMVVLARLVERAGCRGIPAALVLGLTVFGTLVLPYALVLQQHGAAAGLVLCALGAVVARRNATAGCLLALACTIDLTAVFPALFFAWPAYRAGGVQALLRYALGALPALALHLGVNLALVGDAIPVGLHLEAFEYPYSPFMVMSLTGGSHREGEQLAYLWGALFGGSGYFSHHPVVVIAIAAGVAHAVRRGRRDVFPPGVLAAGALSALAIAAYYLTQSRNFGGSAFGMRWFAVFTPLLALFPAAWLAGRAEPWRPGAVWKVALGAAGLWSIAAASLGAVQPWTKFRYFHHQRPDALIASPGSVPPTWREHLYYQWVHVSTFRQDFGSEAFHLWFEDILHRHGRLHTRDWPGFDEAQAEAWVRKGLRELQGVVDLLDSENATRGGGRAVGHFWLAKLHHKLGERAEAAREYEACLTLAPQYGPALKGRAKLDAERASAESASAAR